MAGKIWFSGGGSEKFSGTIGKFKRDRGDKIDLRTKVALTGDAPNGTLIWSGETPTPWGVWTEEGLSFLYVFICSNGDGKPDYELRVGGVEELRESDFLFPKGAVVIEPPPTPIPTPTPPPPLGGGPIGALVRGQSNSLLFCDRGGAARFRDDLKAATGRDVNLIYGWDQANATIHSGTAFLDWVNDGKQAGIRARIEGLPAAQKASPLVVLWMHNESDQKDKAPRTDEWVRLVREDARMMRAAAGRSAAEMPYVFVPVRYPYGDRGPIEAGMKQLAADADFNARFSDVALGSDIRMNGGPEAGDNGSHLGDGDAVKLGQKLAADLAPMFKKGDTDAAKPSIAVELPNAKVGRRDAVVTTKAVADFEVAVFEDDPARNWPWRARSGPFKVDPSGVTTVPVNLVAAGDKVKAFNATAGIDANSGPAVPDPDAPPPPPPPPPPDPKPVAGQAAEIWGRMGMGVNQERFTAVSHGEARSPAYYRRYRDMGFRNVRFFVPAGFESWQVGLSSKASDIAGYLDAVQACVDSGMPVTHIDGTDVIGDWQLDGQGGNVSAANNYVRMFAEAVAKRNYPTDRVIVGACNEYGGTKGNGFWEPHRVRWNGYLRDALPNHTIVEGPSVWKDPRSLFDPNFVPWGNEPKQGKFNPWNDANSLIDCHHYMGWDAGGMNWIGEQVLAWCAANGRKMYMGEHGFDAADGNKAADVPNWIRRMDAESAYDNINRMKQCWWAVTDGSAWRMNAPGGNYLRDGLDVAVKRWAGRIDKSNGLA